jgi:predicted  nucleic acid-binding Zn-ribbon protein
MEEEALDATVEKTAEGAKLARKQAADAARRRDEYEQRIATLKQQHEKRQQRLEFVRNPKEASTLMAELDLARGVLVREEGEWVKLADQVKSSELRATQVEAEVGLVKEGQEEMRTSLAARRSDIEHERAAAQKDRDSAAKGVDKALRVRYERLRTPKRSSVLVALNGATCGACNTAIPMSRRAAIKAGAVIDACENCGVLLYFAE